jgi:hypothetical protein
MIIPTSAAGTYLGAIVIKVKETVTTTHIAITYHTDSAATKRDGANCTASKDEMNPPTDIAGTILTALYFLIRIKLILINIAVDRASKSPFIFRLPKFSYITKYIPKNTTSIAIMVGSFTLSPSTDHAIIAVIIGALLIMISVFAMDVNSKANTKVTELIPKKNAINSPP